MPGDPTRCCGSVCTHSVKNELPARCTQENVERACRAFSSHTRASPVLRADGEGPDVTTGEERVSTAPTGERPVRSPLGSQTPRVERETGLTPSELSDYELAALPARGFNFPLKFRAVRRDRARCVLNATALTVTKTYSHGALLRQRTDIIPLASRPAE